MPAIRSLVIRVYRGQFKPHLTALSNSLSGSTRFGSNNNSSNNTSKNGSGSRTRVSHNLSASMSGTRTRVKGADDSVGPFIRLDDVGTTAEAYYNAAGSDHDHDHDREAGYGRGHPGGGLDLSEPVPGTPGAGAVPVSAPVQSPSRGYFKRWSIFSRKSSEPPQTPMLPPVPTSPGRRW